MDGTTRDFESRPVTGGSLTIGRAAAVGLAVSRLERYATSSGARGLQSVDYQHPDLTGAQTGFYHLAASGTDRELVAGEAFRIVEEGKGHPYTNPAFKHLLARMIEEAYTEADRLPQAERRRKAIEDQVAIAGNELLSWVGREAEGDPLFDGLARDYSRQSITEAVRMIARYGLDGAQAAKRIQEYIEREADRKASSGQNTYPVSRELIDEMVAEGSSEHAEVRARNLRGFVRLAKTESS